jgi:hypothetical protein
MMKRRQLLAGFLAAANFEHAGVGSVIALPS